MKHKPYRKFQKIHYKHFQQQACVMTLLWGQALSHLQNPVCTRHSHWRPEAWTPFMVTASCWCSHPSIAYWVSHGKTPRKSCPWMACSVSGAGTNSTHVPWVSVWWDTVSLPPAGFPQGFGECCQSEGRQCALNTQGTCSEEWNGWFSTTVIELHGGQPTKVALEKKWSFREGGSLGIRDTQDSRYKGPTWRIKESETLRGFSSLSTPSLQERRLSEMGQKEGWGRKGRDSQIDPRGHSRILILVDRKTWQKKGLEKSCWLRILGQAIPATERLWCPSCPK